MTFWIRVDLIPFMETIPVLEQGVSQLWPADQIRPASGFCE